ncbi:MAG: L-lysine dehydrogenase, partial [Nitrospinaceae bacterium]|nr:L-lysine dehydrogenase [Nitrospinaceae bacterium]NIR55760.1 L-lysine dehydrogenase [Nitrospinaceae bacterium]NIS86205.1 L-lysine dehydrogenase [Nitrospinaceae bacterium]NIT83040.1 L-lysine dehydrogenase [Nitrospinaceae bacterium]NIU45253.1 L-lysine dehydrogenase [Nitrospinaceae bacterium]
MKKKIQSVVVIGLGMVGSLVARLFHRSGYQTTGFDKTCQNVVPFRMV